MSVNKVEKTEVKQELKQKRIFPDVVTEVPVRIEPRSVLPLLCMMKQNGNVPVTIESISVKIYKGEKIVLSSTLLQKPLQLSALFWSELFLINLPDDVFGVLRADLFYSLNLAGKRKTIRNSSMKSAKNQILEFVRSEEAIPRFKGVYYGDLRFHDFVPGGLTDNKMPFKDSAEFASSLGLDFYVSSVDQTSTSNGRYFSVYKWNRYRREIEEWNKNSEVMKILSGIETEAIGQNGRSLRVLTVNSDPLSAVDDAGQNGSKKEAGVQLREMLKKKGSETLVFAVQPLKKKSKLKQFFMRKKLWNGAELKTSGVNGMEIFSEVDSFHNMPSLAEWKDALLLGKKRFLTAGSNAAGYFVQGANNGGYSKKSISSSKPFGLVRTALLCRESLTKDRIVQAMAEGRTMVTNGPLLNFIVKSDNGDAALIGGDITSSVFTLAFHVLSSKEFGEIRRVRFFKGDTKTKREEEILSFSFNEKKYNLRQEISIESFSQLGYVRGEVYTSVGEKELFCLTNPIWLRSQ